MPLGGRTLIERVLGWLQQQNVGKVVLNLHHLPESITRVVGDGAHLGLSVRYSWESPILGSAGGPRRALPLLDSDSFLIINGDTLCDVDLGALARAHDASGADVTLAAVPNPAPDRYNGIVTDEDHRITGFVPKGRAGDSWHFVGIQIVKASVFESVSDGAPAETIGGIYRERVAAGDRRFAILPVNRAFFDVGTPQDYLTAALAMADSDNAIEPGARISPRARVTESVVWANSEIGQDVELNRCVVAATAIPAGFKARDSILLPPTLVRPSDGASVTGNIARFPLT
jgi:NDP-sugar pyrophosphorylase family protein